MFSMLAKWFLSLGLGAAAITALSPINPPSDQAALTEDPATISQLPGSYDPITASELSTSLHGRITFLRAQVERSRLQSAIPLARPLTLGSHGDDVKTLQALLVRMGYLTGDAATGYYGPSTAGAIKQFQSDFYMTPTGAVDRATLDKLFDISITRMNLGDIYFPEEESLLAIATSSEKILADSAANIDPVAAGDACPDLPPPAIVYQCPPDAGTAAYVPVTQSFTVTATNYSFTPKTLSARKGDTIKVHYAVTSGTHNFVIDAYGVKISNIGSGKSADISFVATSTGSFTYYSSVSNDKSLGMTGTLTINP